MIAVYALRCGHVVHVTLSSLAPEKRRPWTPGKWWCRTCETTNTITGRIR